LLGGTDPKVLAPQVQKATSLNFPLFTLSRA
jgi:hypothetical protein